MTTDREVLVRVDTRDLRNVWTAVVDKLPSGTTEDAVPWRKQTVVGDPHERYLIVRVPIPEETV